jgi:hypothetical protein
MYVVTLTASELSLVERALDRKLEAKLAPKPRAARPSAASRDWRRYGRELADIMTTTSTPELEAWMGRKRTPGFAPRPFASPAASKPRKATTAQRQDIQRFAEEAVMAWERLGHVVIVEPGTDSAGKPSTAVALDWRNVRVLPLGVTA